MKKKYRWVFYLVFLGALLWGMITPSGIRGAWANNVWSVKFINQYFGLSSGFPEKNDPPVSHFHASQFLIKEAINAGDYDLASSMIAKDLDKSNTLLMETYAQVLYLKGDYPDSFKVWEELNQESPLIQAALHFKEIGQNDLVESAYRSLYVINPEKFAIPLAEELRKNDKAQEGLDILKQVIQDNPGSDQQSNWLRLVGDFYQQAANWDEAEDYYYKAIETKPDDWVAWLTLGNMYYAKNSDLENATKCFYKVIEIVPDRGVGYHSIGFYYNRPDTMTEALYWFKIAAEKEPGNKRYLLSYANALRDTNHMENAFEIYTKLESDYPEDSEVLYELSWAYWHTNQKEMSIELIEKAIRIAPEKIIYYFRAADLHERVGNTDKAKEIFATILSIDPNNIQASQKLNQLNSEY